MPKPSFTVIPIFLSVTVAFATPSHARETNPVVDALNDYGTKYYNQGNMAEAAHEFSKALLVEPDNQTARKYLGKMGFPDGLYPIRGTYADRVMAHATKVEALQKAADEAVRDKNSMEQVASDLARERNDFEKQSNLKEQELIALRQEVNDLRGVGEIAAQLKSSNLSLDVEEQKLAGARAKIEALTAEVGEKDKKLFEDEARLTALNEQLTDLNNGIKDTANAASQKENSAKLDELSLEAEKLRGMLLEEQASLEEKNKELSAANDRTRELEGELARLKEIPSSPTVEKAETGELTNAVILENQKKEIADLKAKIADLEERLELTQRIVQEKEDSLKSLAEQLEEAKSKCLN